jgi:hypothetical protein
MLAVRKPFGTAGKYIHAATIWRQLEPMLVLGNQFLCVIDGRNLYGCQIYGRSGQP